MQKKVYVYFPVPILSLILQNHYRFKMQDKQLIILVLYTNIKKVCVCVCVVNEI